MTTPDEREKEFKLREAKLQAKERELRLRELEMEIHQSQKIVEPKLNNLEPPLSKTRKHNSSETNLKKIGRKIVKFAKFTGFVVAGIAIIKMGLFVGMWLTYFVLTGIIAGIGYQIFLRDS